MDVSHLTAVEQTALLTEYCRAVDARSARAILADPLADATVRDIDYDFASLGATPTVVALVALRAKMLDERIAAFVAEHPSAVVVDLGAGFSSAVFRVDPPETVDWISVDLPAVVAVREALLPPRAGARLVSASVLDPSWAHGIPADRPTFVFADGLLAFLHEEQVMALLQSITGHFASGVIAFNDYGRVSKANRFIGRLTTSGQANSPHRQWNFAGFKDARQPESWNSRLRLLEEASAMHQPEARLFPSGLRLTSRISRSIPSVARKARVLQYRF